MSSTPHRMRAVTNLGTLFTDVGLFERYERAAAAGFNFKSAAELAAEEDILCLIEPINSYTIPGYFLNNYNQAVQVLEDLGKKPNLKLMFDVFHAQQICGQLTATVRQLRHYIGHIQIAQVPARGPPDSPGEIDYHYVFQMLKDEVNHLSNIGCEYNYNGENFDWVSGLGLEF
ncbi:unnamed protein product, partial [Mesorhabditis spiculigera]